MKYTNKIACSHAFRLHTFIHRYIWNEPGVLLCKPSVCCSGNSTSRWINCMPVKRGLCFRVEWGNQFNKTGLNLSLVISCSWKRHKDQFLFQKGVTTHTPSPSFINKNPYVCMCSWGFSWHLIHSKLERSRNNCIHAKAEKKIKSAATKKCMQTIYWIISFSWDCHLGSLL